MDDHLEFFWTCNIIKTELEWEEDKEPLAPFMNCSEAFVHNHIIRGDDPRCVPWASESLKLLQKLEISQNGYASKVGSISEVYDEYTVREGNPMWETVDAGFEEVDSRLKSIEELIGKSGDRRLAETGLGLHECPKDMRCPWRNVNDDREPEHVPCHCFDYGRLANGSLAWKSKRSCRNHHWGLMHLCRPAHIAVKFYIERVMFKNLGTHLEERRRVLWFAVEMIFKELQGGYLDGSPSGWYRTYLNLKEGEFYGFKTLFEGLLGASTLLLLFSTLVFELVVTTVRFPSNLKTLLELRDPSVVEARLRAEDENAEEWGPDEPGPSLEDLRWLFERKLLQLMDGRGARRKYMDMGMILTENIITVLVLAGFFSSLADMNKNFIPREYDTSEKISPRNYIMTHLQGYQLPTELIFELFFDDAAWHGFAWILLYFRALFYFLQLLPGLRWIPMSLAMASVRVLYFLLAYGFLILGFGLLAHIQFGQRFVQFSSLSRTCYELFFLSCGVPGYVFDDLFPFEDYGSWLASMFLALFVVVAVTLGLNFFTTIILDAYNISTNPEAAQQVLDDSWTTICDMLMQSLGIPVRLYVSESSDEAEGGHESGTIAKSVVSEVELQSTSTQREPGMGISTTLAW